MKSTPVFVTGATGHIGANLVRALLASGTRVRAFVLPDTDLAAVEGLDVEVVRGDVRDRDAVTRAMAGCGAVYHLAACISMRRLDRRKLFDVNVVGTANVMHAAAANGRARVLHCSSFGSIGRNPGGASTEESLLNPFEPLMDYELSKALGEVEALRAAAKGLPVVIVNPSAIIGPNDFRPSHLGRMILDAARGELGGYVHGGYDFVPMASVVDGMLRALEHGRPGERYLLTGEVATLGRILEWVAAHTGRPLPRVVLSPRTLLPFAVAKDWVQARFFPESHPRVNAAGLRLLSLPKKGDSTKAERELGWKAGRIEDSVAATVEWFRGRGWLNGRPRRAPVD